MREVLLNDFTSGIQCGSVANFAKGTDTKSANLPQNLQSYHSNTANLNHSGEMPPCHFEPLKKAKNLCEKSSRDISPTAQYDKGAESTQDNAKTKIITLYSKYGNNKATFKTTSAVIMLPLTKGGEYFVFDDVRFFVIAGEGALYYLDCVKAYDFENLEAECLEQFLLTGKQPRDYKQRELIKDFLDIDTKNIQKGKMYLLPKDYEALQIHIMGGCL